MYDKRLNPEYIKNSLNLKIKERSNSFSMGKDFEEHRRLTYRKSCSTLLVIREMHSKPQQDALQTHLDIYNKDRQ